MTESWEEKCETNLNPEQFCGNLWSLLKYTLSSWLCCWTGFRGGVLKFSLPLCTSDWWMGWGRGGGGDLHKVEMSLSPFFFSQPATLVVKHYFSLNGLHCDWCIVIGDTPARTRHSLEKLNLLFIMCLHTDVEQSWEIGLLVAQTATLLKRNLEPLLSVKT